MNSKFAVTASDGSLAIATNMFTVAGGTGDRCRGPWTWRATWT